MGVKGVCVCLEVVSSTRGEGRDKEQFKVSPQCRVGTVALQSVRCLNQEWERERELQRLRLLPLRRSSRWGGWLGRALSVFPTGTWRWHSPRSLCPSRWGAEGKARRPRRSPGGLREASGRRSRSASLLEDDTEQTLRPLRVSSPPSGRFYVSDWKRSHVCPVFSLNRNCIPEQPAHFLSWSNF